MVKQVKNINHYNQLEVYHNLHKIDVTYQTIYIVNGNPCCFNKGVVSVSDCESGDRGFEPRWQHHCGLPMCSLVRHFSYTTSV